MLAARTSMLGARTRVFSQSEIEEGRANRARSIFDDGGDMGDDTESAQIGGEVEVKSDSEDSNNDIIDCQDCRKRTQNACNNGRKTKRGKIMVFSMLGTIVLSVTMIILDSLNYQYCENPCPVQQTKNMSYEEEWPIAKQSEYIRSKMDDMLNTGVDMEPSGTAFFVVHLPGACYVPACQATSDTYCTYIRDRGQLTFSQLLGFEIFCTIIFTIEFIVRLVVAQSYCPKCCCKSKDYSTEPPFFTQMFTYLDFLAILPFYVELIAAVYFGEDGSITNNEPGYLVFLDIFKLFRIFRVFKLIRLYEGSFILFETIAKALPTIKLSLILLFLFFTTGGGVLLCLEPCNGDPFSNDCEFPDMLQSGYYIWITIFSVGYGDQVPQNIASKILGMFFMLLGTIFLAMPLTVIGTLYNQMYNNYENQKNKEKKKQKSLEKDELPKSERKLRLLKTGMLAFNSILQAETYLRSVNSDGPSDVDVEEKLDGSSDDAKKTLGEECEERSVDRRKQVVDIHKHLYVLQVYHYNISKDLVALYSSLERFKPPKPRKLTIKVREQHISVVFEEQSKSSSRCSWWRGTKSQVVPEMQEDAGKVNTKPWVKDVEELRKEARKPNASWRDKLWLWLENSDKSSRSRTIAGYVRAVILCSSFIVTMISAWPEFQLSYGPAAPSCERAARDYCNLLHALPDDWKWPGGKSVTIDWSQRWDGMTKEDVIRANPYCFEMSCGMLNAAPVAQATRPGTYTAPVVSEQNKKYCRDFNKDPNETIYAGCSDVSNAHCSWPVVNADYSFYDIQCPTVIGSSTATVETQTFDANGKLVTTELKTTITKMSGPQPFDTSTLGQQIQSHGVFYPLNHNVPVCNRKVCQNLEEDNITYNLIKILGQPYGFNKLLLIMNTILVMFFLIEFGVKLLAMRSPKRFFLTRTPGFYNWAELLVLLISLVELCVVSANFSTSMEGSAENGDAWGYEVFGDPFFSLFHFPSDNFRIWSLVVPLRFILQMRGVSMIRVIASTYVSAMHQLLIPILAMVLVVFVLSAFLFTFETAFACTVARVRNNKFDDGSVAYRYVPNYPHTFYKDGPHDETDPTECPLQNYVDSIWLGFVTMTSVGYGVLVPKTFLGKMSSLCLGVFGAFYMSMPLTIVGSKFTVNYQLDVENQRKTKLRRKFRKFVDQLVHGTTFKRKRVFYTDGAHVEVSMPQQKKQIKVWKKAVVIQVKRKEETNADQGIYKVQYTDGTSAWVSHKLMRHLDAHAAARATRSNLAVFRKHMQLVPPNKHGFHLVNIMQLKECHQQLMRCLGNIYDEEITRPGLSIIRSKSPPVKPGP